MNTTVSEPPHQPQPPTQPPIPCPQTPSRRFRGAGASISLPETPRRRRNPPSQRLQGVKTNLPQRLSLQTIKTTLIEEFKLSYVPDDWQIHLIRRILQGFDSIFCAGTGYGKSLVFEGLGLLGGEGSLVVVICPLKALENDQANQAKEKGLDALVINEDTSRTAELWQATRTKARMVYMSPEMVLSDSFQKLWRDSRFRNRLTAVLVDEAHCIEDWGDDDFRPAYRKLEILRNYTGQEISIEIFLPHKMLNKCFMDLPVCIGKKNSPKEQVLSTKCMRA